MRIHLTRRPSGRRHQLAFPFMERSGRRVRWFKRLIILVTSLLIVEILWTSPWGHYGAATAAAEAREAVRHVLGLPKPRSEIDEAWRQYRELGIETSRRALDRVFDEADP